MKKILCMYVYLISMVMLFSKNVYAEENIRDLESKDYKSMVDETDNIDVLFEIRMNLSNDFDKNGELIIYIDEKLEQLGVEEIGYNELVNKLKRKSMIQSFVALNPSTTVKWTSTRQTTCYRGKMYELQIVRGVPSNNK